MAAVRIQEAASHRLDEIYRYTRDHWGTEQADQDVTGLFEAFNKIDSHDEHRNPFPRNSASRDSSSDTNGISSIGSG